jgi:hypothetical protein
MLKRKVFFNIIICLFIFSCITQSSYCYAAKISASSTEDPAFLPQNVYDNNLESRWSSEFSDDQWLEIDFQETKSIEGLLLYWQEAFAVSYEVLLSEDGENWRLVYSQNDSQGGCEEIIFQEVKVKKIKIVFKKRATQWGYSLFEVYPLGKDFYDFARIDPEMIISLDGEWLFKTDPKNVGVKDKWFLDNYQTDGWSPILSGEYWEKQGYDEYDGYAWYKKDVFIPKSWKGASPGIIFGGVDDAYELYINGKRIASFGTLTSDSSSVFNTVTTFLLDKNTLKPGKLNQITMRVYDFWGSGGIIKRPMILFKQKELLEALKEKTDIQGYYRKKARPSQRKYYPQWVGGRQAYWTVVGTEKSKKEATFCEDGMLQLYNQGPSLMPYIYLDGQLLTAFDFDIKQSLKLGYLPMPKVVWENDKLFFSQEVFAAEHKENSYVCLRCILKNRSEKAIQGKLFFTLRPFQVNPSWQWAGGMAEIKKLEFDANNIIKVNNCEKIVALENPDKFDVVDYISGDIIDKVKKGRIDTKTSITDIFGYASGALEYDFSLRGNKQKEYLFIISLTDKKNTLSQLLNTDSLYEKLFKQSGLYKDFAAMEEKTSAYWQKELNKVDIKIPDKEMLNTVKSSLAYILINRDGPMLQAGSGAYEKSWIRDACISSAALLRMGYTEEVRQYIDWISEHIDENGKVPPIMVSKDHADPAWETVYEEYDSQGQYIFSVLQYYYFTRDKEWLRNKLPAVIRVLDCMERLRTSTMNSGDKKEYQGLFPLSVSHEGYFPPPGVHSYWDDFWGLKGLKDALTIAEILEDEELSQRVEAEIKSFRKSVQDSISLVQQIHGINYIPGCAERGDFDAPSAAIAVWPTGEAEYLSASSVYNTFGIFWTEQFAPSLKNDINWSYPSYALRISQVFVLFNQRDKAVRMLEQYLNLKRPRDWNQWAEGTLSDDRKPWFIGDLPHSWVASIYVNSFRSLFVYERNDFLVLAGGIPQKWISEEEIAINNFPTYYGNISYSIVKKQNVIYVSLTGNATPPKGFLLKLKPAFREDCKITVNSKPYKGPLDEGIHFKTLPAEISIVSE